MKKTRKNNLKLVSQTVILKVPRATIECPRLWQPQSVREEWREQTTRGIAQMCGLAEASDQEALGRVKAVGEFLRATLEYLQATERFNCAFGIDDSQLDIPNSTAEA
jgi:hypothetical protein